LARAISACEFAQSASCTTVSMPSVRISSPVAFINVLCQFRPGQKLHGFNATGQRQIAYQHVHAVVQIAVQVMNESMLRDGKGRAGFAE